MANLRTVLETYCAVQRLSTRDDIFRRTTFDQRLTISLREFLSVSDIFDESLLADYEAFLRKSPIAAGFRNLVDLTWDNFPKLAERKFSFYLNAPKTDIRFLFAEINFEAPCVEENSILRTPTSSKRPRMSKKDSYSPATLAKYSKAIENGIINLFAMELPSASLGLKCQVLKATMLRLQKHFNLDNEGDEAVNKRIVSNIKYLVLSLKKYGRYDREQIRFIDGISFAIAGETSIIKSMEATGLSRKSIETGRKMRTQFDEVIIKAEAEASKDNADVSDESDNIDTVEADSENGSESNMYNSESVEEIPWYGMFTIPALHILMQTFFKQNISLHIHHSKISQ